MEGIQQKNNRFVIDEKLLLSKNAVFEYNPNHKNSIFIYDKHHGVIEKKAYELDTPQTNSGKLLFEQIVNNATKPQKVNEAEADFYVNKYGLAKLMPDDIGYIDIWDGSLPYTFSEQAEDYYISSSNASDTGIAIVEVLVVDGTDWLRQNVSVTLNGQTPVKIEPANQLKPIRCNRAWNDSEASLVGDLYIHANASTSSGIPTDMTKVRAMVLAGYEQTKQAVYSVPSKLEDGTLIKMAHIIEFKCDIVKKRSVSAEAQFLTREYGKIFRSKKDALITDDKGYFHEWGIRRPLKLAPKGDMLIRIDELSSTGISASADFSAELIEDDGLQNAFAI
jgi:hypothetical protein